MGRLIDFTSKRFGRWLVLSRAANEGTKTMWVCRCDCGAIRDVAAPSLTNGVSNSCGCLNLEVLSARSITHGGRYTKEYSVWCAMKARCRRNPSYIRRGITVCSLWENSFSIFLAGVGECPSNIHQLDRVDNNRGYEPGNCRWATPKENARNHSRNVLVTYEGETLTLIEWTERLSLPYNVMRNRIVKMQMNPEEAFTTPVGSLRWPTRKEVEDGNNV